MEGAAGNSVFSFALSVEETVGAVLGSPDLGDASDEEIDSIVTVDAGSGV